MENIILHLKLFRGMGGTLLAYVVWCYIKAAHISPGYGAYLNLEEMITRAPIINSRMNVKLSQESLESVYHDHQCDTISCTDMDAYVYRKQRKG